MKKRIIIGATAGALILTMTTASVYASSLSAGNGFVDVDNDGVCDNYDASAGSGYVDADNDGVCDNYDAVLGSGARQLSDGTGKSSNAANQCAQYSDENNDGVCDHCQNESRPLDGTGNQYGKQGSTQCDHEQMNHGYCHRNRR